MPAEPRDGNNHPNDPLSVEQEEPLTAKAAAGVAPVSEESADETTTESNA